MSKNKLRTGPVMKPEDIVKDYKEAKFKRNQIKILADLNLCSQDEIKRILRENGVVLPGGSKPKKKSESENEKVDGSEKINDVACSETEDEKAYSNLEDLKRIEELEKENKDLKFINSELEDEACDAVKRLCEIVGILEILLAIDFTTLSSFTGVKTLLHKLQQISDGR